MQCGHPLDSSRATRCGQCQAHPPFFDHSGFAFAYQPPITSLIKQMKFQQRLDIARALGRVLAGQLLSSSEPLPEALIPVPLYHSRLRQRGYNQALEIARPIAKQLGIPLELTLCKRSRPTREQSHLPFKERKKNIRGAFRVTSRPKYQHVALIDDVVTTTNTINELARVLKQAGINKVDVWGCCRATLSK
ncbi:MAG: ComF family protein [Gammaproteobacteria bacterium]|nr:ComF family protein [Gammaproteobacteria bacterium]